MTIDNKRGAVRKRPDPIAIATKGRQTTYDINDGVENVKGIKTILKTNSNRTILKQRVQGGTIYSETFTLDSVTYPSKNNIEFDIGTGVLTNGG